MDCLLCRGAGVRWNGETCESCNGNGKLEIPAREPSPESVTFLGVLKQTHEKYRCRPCDGSGICPWCLGNPKFGRLGPRGGGCSECHGVSPDDSPGRLSGALLPLSRRGDYASGGRLCLNPEIRELLKQGAGELECWWGSLGEIEVGLAPQAGAKGLDGKRAKSGPTGLCRSCSGTGSRDRRAEERELNALAEQWDEEVLPQLRSRGSSGNPITPREDPFKLPKFS